MTDPARVGRSDSPRVWKRGGWRCSHCQARNPPFETTCLRCGETRDTTSGDEDRRGWDEQSLPETSNSRCASPRLAARGLCTCIDPRLCPYSEAGRKRAKARMRQLGLLDKRGKLKGRL
jgi:hypothetical protein